MIWAIRDTLFWTFFWLLPMAVTVSVCWIFLSAPARRNERARLFLDLLETGLQQGQSPERTIVSVSETRDATVGVYFHLLAAHLEEGLRLHLAMEKTPNLLPPSVAAAVKIGSAEGTLDKMLPAARGMLEDVNSRVRSALNHLVLFALVILPTALFLMPMLSQFVWPKFEQIMLDMEVPTPAFTAAVFDHMGWAAIIEAIIVLGLFALGFCYVGGPRISLIARKIFGSLPDEFILWLPWRRNRVHRDFTGALAVLLDAGVNEARAVELAAQASANRIFQKRAKNVIARLREGVPLPEALKAIERDREFQWRWANALRTGRGFFDALRGWHETLEARAFQQEQAAAQAITTGIVLVNGAMVAVIVMAVFLILIAIIEAGFLW